MSTNPNIDAKRQRVLTTAHDHWKALLFQGIAMLILGVLAITLPNCLSVGCLLSPASCEPPSSLKSATCRDFGGRYRMVFW